MYNPNPQREVSQLWQRVRCPDQPVVTPFLLSSRTVFGKCRGEVSSRAEVCYHLQGEPPFHLSLVPESFAFLLSSRSIYSQPTTVYTLQLVPVKLLLSSLIHSLSALRTYTHAPSLLLTHSHPMHRPIHERVTPLVQHCDTNISIHRRPAAAVLYYMYMLHSPLFFSFWFFAKLDVCQQM